MKQKSCKPTRRFAAGGALDPNGYMDHIERDNEEKTKRWAMDGIADQMKYAKGPEAGALSKQYGEAAKDYQNFTTGIQYNPNAQRPGQQQPQQQAIAQPSGSMSLSGMAKPMTTAIPSIAAPTIASGGTYSLGSKPGQVFNDMSGRMGFAGGGKPETADEVMARMAAKYGTSGATSQPEPVQQVAQAPVQQPKPQGMMQQAIGLIGNRRAQIDKAVGYANGGKIKGPGTATSDSIPARVNETGEPIKVSTSERIVSAAQDKALQAIAVRDGYDNLDQMLESLTGKPVGPTIKGGMAAAANGMEPYNRPNWTYPGGELPPNVEQQPRLAAPQPGTSIVPDNRPNWVPGNQQPADRGAIPGNGHRINEFDDEVRQRAAANRAKEAATQAPVQSPVQPAQQPGKIRQALSAARPYANAALTGAAVVGNASTAMNSDDPNVQVAETIKGALTAIPATRPIGYGLQLADPLAKAVTGYGLAEGIGALAKLHPDYMRENKSKPLSPEQQANQDILNDPNGGMGTIPGLDVNVQGQKQRNMASAVDPTQPAQAVGMVNSQPLTTKDIVPGGYIDQGAGIIAQRSKNGQLNVTNVGTSGMADQAKTLYADAQGKGTNDWSQTAQYAQGIAQAAKDKETLAGMQRDRMVRDTGSDITDPGVRANAMQQIAMLDKQDLLKQHGETAQLQQEGLRQETQGKKTANEQAQAIGALQTKAIAGDQAALKMLQGLSGKAQRDAEAKIAYREEPDPNNPGQMIKTPYLVQGEVEREIGAKSKAAPKYEVGKTYKDGNGNQAIYQKDGTWKEVK